MLDPETGLILFVVGGIGTVASFAAFKVAEQMGPQIEAKDLLPSPFPYPPVPRFLFKKPEVLAELRKR
uniref:Uncharacterized protein n=1 Tax=viral metagenome TaxID=1070528 RepID=A0A6M3M356_9ZZZZ